MTQGYKNNNNIERKQSKDKSTYNKTKDDRRNDEREQNVPYFNKKNKEGHQQTCTKAEQ